ncbi:hypothetical protein [Saccharothrix texasensis]|uniref:hypothetical protein n=1 Tax=Saccharothrix texasensis TaxID=103734 RepID=UPI0011CDC450|nr:hypothetical protein [Saccharothrix texasensis]
MFLDLEVASQLASALALPLAVLLAIFALSPSVQASAPFPWRRALIISAIVIACIGILATGYAVRQNIKDLNVELSGQVRTDGKPWTHGGAATLVLPELYRPPPRENLTLVVSLKNTERSGDCERTARLEFVPVIDGRKGWFTTVAPRTDVTIPLGEVHNEAHIEVTIRYETANIECKVLMQIDKAVLHD